VFCLLFSNKKNSIGLVASLFRVGILLGFLLLFVWLLLLPLLGLVLYYYSLCPVALCLIKWRVLLLFLFVRDEYRPDLPRGSW
jgi:hypothetical protein